MKQATLEEMTNRQVRMQSDSLGLLWVFSETSQI